MLVGGFMGEKIQKTPKLIERLKQLIGTKIEVDFGGFLGGAYTGILKEVYPEDNYMELIECHPGNSVQLMNVGEAQAISIEEE